MSQETCLPKVSICIPFPTAHTALLAYEVLSVDKELLRSEVHKQISTEGSNLLLNFDGRDFKRLRVAVNAAFKNIILIIKTMEKFQ